MSFSRATCYAHHVTFNLIKTMYSTTNTLSLHCYCSDSACQIVPTVLVTCCPWLYHFLYQWNPRSLLVPALRCKQRSDATAVRRLDIDSTRNRSPPPSTCPPFFSVVSHKGLSPEGWISFVLQLWLQKSVCATCPLQPLYLCTFAL
jgi:hypothetical protein